MPTPVYKSRVIVALLFCCASAVVTARPVCNDENSDSDGDGFGWEAGETCVVAENTNEAPASGNNSGRDKPLCQSTLSDPDGDGFGWENNQSCRVVSNTATTTGSSSTKPECSSASADPDGDGFGWENNRSCVVSAANNTNTSIGSLSTWLPEEKVTLRVPACSSQRFDSDGDGFGWENSQSCTFKNAGDAGRNITDVVLVTGQSNALGAETIPYDPYDPALDSPVKRVYAYSQNGWGIAGLQQIWDRGWYPRSDIGGEPANNFAFHFGKTLVRRNADTVVGIIMVTAPGAGISHWDSDGDFFARIDSRVRAALNALPGNPKVSGVLWHQGETDYYSTDSYGSQLRTVIGNFRSQSWLANGAVFICGETLNSPVNERLMALNADGEAATGCVVASDLQSVGDDIHFDARSLRTLGKRYADKYQSLNNR